MAVKSSVSRAVRKTFQRFGYTVERMDRAAPTTPILDVQVLRVLDRLHAQPQRPPKPITNNGDPYAFADYGYAIDREQGKLIYLLCRALQATRVADFATSLGVSTIYSAAAVRDNGGGVVIGSEIVPEKVSAARRNLADAGLAEFAEIREGDARETLRDLGGSVDLVLVDGWGPRQVVGSSLAGEVIQIVAPQLRLGGVALNDNRESDYLAFVRDPANGFRSMSLPLKGGTELSVRVQTASPGV